MPNIFGIPLLEFLIEELRSIFPLTAEAPKQLLEGLVIAVVVQVRYSIAIDNSQKHDCKKWGERIPSKVCGANTLQLNIFVNGAQCRVDCSGIEKQNVIANHSYNTNIANKPVLSEILA
jgi:hypothetical protein